MTKLNDLIRDDYPEKSIGELVLDLDDVANKIEDWAISRPKEDKKAKAMLLKVWELQSVLWHIERT